VFGARETRTDSARERHRARETALQLLYQWDVGRIGAREIDDALDLFWTVHPAPAPRRELALGLARGAVSALPKIDLLIGRHTDNWRSERLAVVDRLIMRLAVYELLFEKTPAAVVINEALELAKTFSGERAVAFINGVLDAVRRAVAQQDEGSALGT
jgi:N utilization substance protein B